MKPWRAVLAAVVVLGALGLVRAWPGSSVDDSVALDAPGIPAASDADAVTSTWYCAASTAPTDPAPKHLLALFSPSGVEGTVRLTGFTQEGPPAEAVVEVTAGEPTMVDAAASLGVADASVMVESSVADLVVEHRLTAAEGVSQVPCARSAADRWYFPAQTTLLDTAARLVLFNPFPKDASVDIVAAADGSVIAPPALTGVVVPAGTKRVIDLGEHVQRRPLFSVSVQLRTGRLIAETVEWLNIPEKEGQQQRRGLRLQLGVPQAQTEWVFAGGFTGEGAQEKFVAYNPGTEPVAALMQVVPYGAGELLPEPFELEVPPRRSVVLDLSEETRIPPVGFHAMRVTTADGGELVVGRVADIVGTTAQRSTPEQAQRPPIDLGTAIGTAAPGAATAWSAITLPTAGEFRSTILVHNPGDGISRVSARIVGGELDGTLLAEDLEVAAGDSAAIQTTGVDPTTGAINVIVESDTPVVVERLMPYKNQMDLSMGLAVPLLGRAERLASLNGD